MKSLRRNDPLRDPERLIRRVYSYVAYRIGDGPEAEDVTSDVFERALRYRHSFDPKKGEPIAWLLGIAHRCIQSSRSCELHVPLDLIRNLGRTLRDADWKVTAVLCDDVLVDVEPGDTTAHRFALAFDLGTTTVVANLLDLETGQPAAVRSMLNKQQPFGADVITRISTVMMDPDALGRLRSHSHETLA